MQRRKLLAEAKSEILKAMAAMSFQLTAIEWTQVFHDMMQRMLTFGLKEEWEKDQTLLGTDD